MRFVFGVASWQSLNDCWLDPVQIHLLEDAVLPCPSITCRHAKASQQTRFYHDGWLVLDMTASRSNYSNLEGSILLHLSQHLMWGSSKTGLFPAHVVFGISFLSILFSSWG